MANPNLIMKLGLGRRAYRDLDAFERFVWAERLRAYCIFPTDADQRNAYQACKSAQRIQGLESAGPKYIFPESLDHHRVADKSRYLPEERTFFRSVGGMNTLLRSYGLSIYKDYESVSTTQCFAVLRIFLNLAQQHNTPSLLAPGSLAKAVGIFADSFPHTKTQEKNGRDEPKSDTGVIGRPIVKGITGGNEKYALRLWRHYKPALPICIAYGMMFFHSLTEAFPDRNFSELELSDFDRGHFDSERNVFYSHSDGAVYAFLTAKAFLTTHFPHSQDKPYLLPDEHWNFASGFISGFEAGDLSTLGPLADIDISRAQSHRAPDKKYR